MELKNEVGTLALARCTPPTLHWYKHVNPAILAVNATQTTTPTPVPGKGGRESTASHTPFMFKCCESGHVWPSVHQIYLPPLKEAISIRRPKRIRARHDAVPVADRRRVALARLRADGAQLHAGEAAGAAGSHGAGLRALAAPCRVRRSAARAR